MREGQERRRWPAPMGGAGERRRLVRVADAEAEARESDCVARPLSIRLQVERVLLLFAAVN
jgi:hypothetical protein